MSRDYRLYLKDIVEEAQFIERQTQGLDYEAFITEEVRLKAVLHSLTIIGEASNHIPEDIRGQVADVPWRAIIGVRNIIVHGYFNLNLPIIWDVVANEVTDLRRHVEALLRELDEDA